MSRGKSEGPTRQTALDFEGNHAITMSTKATDIVEATTGTAIGGRARQPSLIRLVDHHRARHQEVVRKLLAEAGVFRVR